MMRYLGRLSGAGMLKCDGADVGNADYDFEGYFRAPLGVTSSGEIRVGGPLLHALVGRSGLQILTAEGVLLDLRFSEKSLPDDGDAAHVDVIGGLPRDLAVWCH